MQFGTSWKKGFVVQRIGLLRMQLVFLGKKGHVRISTFSVGYERAHLPRNSARAYSNPKNYKRRGIDAIHTLLYTNRVVQKLWRCEKAGNSQNNLKSCRAAPAYK
ncbi:hypothetical protein ABFS82_03G066600 [Erythranthe guttata]|uniref:uncharacterized protein LOC105956453 n=1 Tax=Erythranthe guttata TaxID=4155 RepID=UPI00064DB24C|nr:PREDICTED: uncharacterized protein LOC105956453 [Erythranthe guttata]|eukprot:XP_012835758.1 PREDICTED: uncharacterized protein LOC105956453 [Erythranthe guttata]